MIDLFKLPGDFPGLNEARKLPCLERVRFLEQHFADDIDEQRFIPYLQLHEFEALILVGLPELVLQHPNRKQAIIELSKRLERDFQNPEEIDGLRPPSYWIKDVIPEYSKRLDGVATIERVGLPKLRKKCRHFNDWLGSLEGLESSQVSPEHRSVS